MNWTINFPLNGTLIPDCLITIEKPGRLIWLFNISSENYNNYSELN